MVIATGFSKGDLENELAEAVVRNRAAIEPASEAWTVLRGLQLLPVTLSTAFAPVFQAAK
jgi:hypothetical protein